MLLFKISNQQIYDLIGWKDFLWQTKQQYWVRWLIWFQSVFQPFSAIYYLNLAKCEETSEAKPTTGHICCLQE